MWSDLPDPWVMPTPPTLVSNLGVVVHRPQRYKLDLN